MGFFEKLKQGMKKTREGFGRAIRTIFQGKAKIDDDLYEQIEETLITADIGVETTMAITDQLEAQVEEEEIRDPQLVHKALVDIMGDMLAAHTVEEPLLPSGDKPLVIMVIGVNGVGKTTSIAKLAKYYKDKDYSVLLAAADTFRAGAIDQIDEWANRIDVPLIKKEEGADPASVVYDAIYSAKSRQSDVLICDTAGRLHNKKNLMNELEKMNRIIEREYPEADYEALLVLDATTGQNAIAQTRAFGEVTKLTGIILTKLDGTAKGGVVFPLQVECGIPVRFIGVGEGMDDLRPFEAQPFIDAIFALDEGESGGEEG